MRFAKNAIESTNKLMLIQTENIPGQDPELWGQELFQRVLAPVDWCTVRQGQEERNRKGYRDFEIPDGLVKEYIADPVLFKQRHPKLFILS